MDTPMLADQPKNYINQLGADTEFRQEDLPRSIGMDGNM